MNLFLAAAPHAQIAHGRLGCEVNIDDLADRPARPLDSGDVIDIGAPIGSATSYQHHPWSDRLLRALALDRLTCRPDCVGLALAVATEELVDGARHVPAACWRRSLPRLDSGMPWGRLRPSNDSTARTSVARCTGLRAMAAWSRPVAWHGSRSRPRATGMWGETVLVAGDGRRG